MATHNSDKRFNRRLLVLLGLLLLIPFAVAFSESKNVETSCLECHGTIDETLPPGHEPVAGNTIRACLDCHMPMTDGKAVANRFSARLHRPHARKTVNAACASCHVTSTEGRFGLPGQPLIMKAPDPKTLSILGEIFNTWAESAYMDNIHAKQSITCAGCHGGQLPVLDDRPTNERCFQCHGSYPELAAKTPGADFADRNPHASHLGEIACTVCHKAHEASINYCLDCHGLFKMNPIPGRGK
jgi:hypothetical protein